MLLYHFLCFLRVHYDPRIFSAKQTKSKHEKKMEDPEKEYFDKMSRFYGELNEKFSGKPMTQANIQGGNVKVVFIFAMNQYAISPFQLCSKTPIKLILLMTMKHWNVLILMMPQWTV